MLRGWTDERKTAIFQETAKSEACSSVFPRFSFRRQKRQNRRTDNVERGEVSCEALHVHREHGKRENTCPVSIWFLFLF
jgi:hypothetical protein